MLRWAGELAARTMIFDVEPLVAYRMAARRLAGVPAGPRLAGTCSGWYGHCCTRRYGRRGRTGSRSDPGYDARTVH